MDNKPLVSIVLPTYNRASLLGKAIETCLNQTYKNIELIIVDDGSKDNTQEVAESFAVNDNRVKYYKKDNGKLPRALNYGFERANGEYLTWTSDDNSYEPEAIEEMVNLALEQSGPCLIYASYNLYYPDSNTTKLYNFPAEKIKQFNVVGACFLYHNEVKDAIGDYNPDLILIEDYDYWLRIASKFPVIHLDKVLYTSVIHKDTLTVRKLREVYFLFVILHRRHRYTNKLIFSLKLLKKFFELLVSRDAISYKINCLKFVSSKLHLAEPS